MAQAALPTFPANALSQVHWASGNTLRVLNAAAADRVDTLDACVCVRPLRAFTCSRGC